MAWQSTWFLHSLPRLDDVLGLKLWGHPLGTENMKGLGVLKTIFSRSVLPMLLGQNPLRLSDLGTC